MRIGPVLFFTAVFIISGAIESSAQNAVDSNLYLKHQIGFNATESIRLFEKESEKAYKISYRYKLSHSTALRFGVNYQLDTSDQGKLELDIRTGLDREFKKSGNWIFYFGGDITGGIEKLASSNRNNYQAGLAPFLGILFKIDEHLSISTEPGLLIEVRRFKNQDTFNPDNSEVWVEMEFINVGQLIIGVHF